jgi:hypothetical protein
MSNLSYGHSKNNVPKYFDIFSPVFCVAITCQCVYVNSASGQMFTYSTNMYCIFFMYIKNLFNIYYIHFTTLLKLKCPSIFLTVVVTERC